MANDNYTVLNIATVPGGDVMDESGITYGVSPLVRKAPRIVLRGEGVDEIVVVLNTTPSVSSTDYGVAVRHLGIVASRGYDGANNPLDALLGAGIPGSALLLAASDGTNLRQLLVESGSSFNLRTGLWDGDNRASVSAGGALKVDGSAATQPISGTITANAGTNLNTSALNLEATQTAMSAKLPATLGQKTSANSMAVVIASDQSVVPFNISQVAGNAAVTGGVNGSIGVGGLAANAASVSGNPVLMGGSDGSKVRSVSTNAHGNVLIDYQTALLDSFGRLRVANPETIFDSKQISDKQPLFWDDQQTTGSGTSSTHNTNQASTTMAVSNATAGTRVRQTFRQFNYQPGKSQLMYMTFVMSSAPVAGIIRRVGQFNANDGVFFEQNGTVLNFVRRTFTSGSAVDNVVAQSSWNLDKLDGTGASGITLDVTKTNILVIDYEWLGVGSIRYGFVIGGRLIYAHQTNNANTLSVVWMSNPNLPLRYEIVNGGAGPAASLTHICSTVITEGGRDVNALGLDFTASRGATALTTLNNASLYPVVAMRLRSGYTYAQIIPKQISCFCTSNANLEWKLLLNPTVTGTAFSFSTIANSAVEVDVSRTNATTVSGGTAISGGYVAATNFSNLNLSSDLSPGVNIAGVADVLVLAVRRVTGTTEDLYGSINWHESQ